MVNMAVHCLSDLVFHNTRSDSPLTFEDLGQGSGFVLYETPVEELFTDPAKLEVKGIK